MRLIKQRMDEKDPRDAFFSEKQNLGLKSVLHLDNGSRVSAPQVANYYRDKLRKDLSNKHMLLTSKMDKIEVPQPKSLVFRKDPNSGMAFVSLTGLYT